MDIRKFLVSELKGRGFVLLKDAFYLPGEFVTGIVSLQRSRHGRHMMVNCGIAPEVGTDGQAYGSEWYAHGRIQNFVGAQRIATLDALDPSRPMPDELRQELLSHAVAILAQKMTEEWMDLGWLRRHAESGLEEYLYVNQQCRTFLEEHPERERQSLGD